MTATSRDTMDSGWRIIKSSLGHRMVRALSANEKHTFLNAVLQSITAIKRLSSEASYVLSVTEGYDIIKTIPSGCDALLTTLNEILDLSLQGIENDEEKEERRQSVEQNTSSNP